ncbi:Reverse transcriptase domain [Arabidopsis thaliana x Arabidopsis arenosa]|nr:Reverse transcriptase domain [Arabidopsis thaliana x Arabidopsis arenosa]
MFTLSRKLKFLKRTIKSFSKDHFSGLELKVQQAFKELTACQNSLLLAPSPILASREKEAHRVWLNLAIAEERFFCQKSRVNWLANGDLNTSFFKRMVATRRSANLIHYLLDNSGRKIENHEELANHCVGFFTELLGNGSNPLTQDDITRIQAISTFSCDNEMRDMLVAEITDEEIKSEFFNMPRNKSPGPDGYSPEFFTYTWSVIGEDVLKAVKEFFLSGQLLKQWNNTAITLIPKKPNADKITDFRPISCCNVLYKVISKILARRLEHLLTLWISPSQSAFVKGRLLSENVLLATELVQGFGQKNISRRGVLKVDLRKAFDSVSWDFILQVLLAANIPQTYVNWIKQCLTTTSFSININGSLCGFFRGANGLRQGDPLSPSLFVIALEIFTRLLEKKFDDGSIGYHPKAKDLKISSLAFADDLMIFYDGKISSLHGITSVLNDFQALSGLAMNREKSGIYTAGLSPQESIGTMSFGFLNGSFPFRYLGLPLLHRKLRRTDYSPLIDQISARFNHWTTKTLSFAGRLQLISSVIYSSVNFWMSTFILPKCCLSTIESLCNRFLWSADITKKGGIKVSWQQACLPKSEGGLGLRNFRIWNKTLNLRLIWLLFTNTSSLWVAWTRYHRLRNANFWNAKPSDQHSWIWKALLDLRPLAKRFLRCKVANGKTASYWYDHWNNLGPLIEHVGSSGPQLMGIPDSALVEDAIGHSGWLLPSAHTRNSTLVSLRDVLLETQIPAVSLGPDTYHWSINGSSSTVFLSKQTWEELRPVSIVKSWAKVVWYKGHIPKFAFTFWVTHLDRLPVRSRLAAWGINTPTTCCTCNREIETRDHLFLHCDYSSQIWSIVLSRLGQPRLNFTDWSDLIVWLSSSSGSQSLTLKRLTVQVTIFSIWKERNNRLHNMVSTSHLVIFNQIDRSIRDSILARINRRKFRNLLSRWFTYE